MLFLVAILIGVVAGLLRGGRLSHLARLRLRWLWLVPLSLVIQLLIFPLFSEVPFLPYATAPLHVLSYALAGLWLIVNLRVIPLAVVGIGALANLLVVAANGGRMPASTAALRAAGWATTADHLVSQGRYGNVVLMGETTRLNWLGDYLYLPSWIPFSTAFSIGDVLIMVGLVWLIARGMVTND
jgi:hypothetical protein